LLEFDKRFADDLIVGITFAPPKTDEVLPDTDPVLENIQIKYQKYQKHSSEFKRIYRRATFGRVGPNSIDNNNPLLKSETRDDSTIPASLTLKRRTSLRKVQSSANLVKLATANKKN